MDRFSYGLRMISAHMDIATNHLAASNMIGLANTGERDHDREAEDNLKN